MLVIGNSFGGLTASLVLKQQCTYATRQPQGCREAFRQNSCGLRAMDAGDKDVLVLASSLFPPRKFVLEHPTPLGTSAKVLTEKILLGNIGRGPPGFRK